jgi:glycine cleavage system transcriptional repressor
MSRTALISIICEDRIGLVAAVTGRLYDLGINLGDTTFAVLGGAAEFTTVAELPDHQSLGGVEAELSGLPALKGAKISVAPFSYRAQHGDTAHITHRIEIEGEDSPGLVARLSEVFVGFGANIVRLNSERVSGGSGARYITRIAAWIPPEKAKACLATVANTAGELRLTCKTQAV